MSKKRNKLTLDMKLTASQYLNPFLLHIKALSKIRRVNRNMRTSRAEWITGQLDFKGSPDLKSGYLKQLISRYHQVFSNAKTKQRIIRNCAQVSLQALGNRFSEVGQILLYPSFEQKADNA
ncbi:hypothetical protein Bca4012_049792 [Brassica carinata]|uniref:BnaCnng26220D protein n=3 Tax=Brassica TaxID=3705 RepID=A0A078IVV0_BRANA|nr:hypothetical protein HID58_047000 [Brassica napus]CAF1906070.1 unnamed protein product [Brassica napus]CDY54142.1 BnaCnng26220D [Brassica napus]VDD22485.1 unnamed protein product [Brassica oleracea]